MNKHFMRKTMVGALPLVFGLATSLLVTGCGGGGSDSYDAPESTSSAPIAGQTQNVLIDAATLKGWIDQGLVNNNEDYENIVIIDVTSAADYAAGHIPGAQLWEGNSGIERYEGPIYSSNMVLDGPAMDAVLQQYGIDERTTVVFAGASNPSRIYFMFRYWGFPKERLKVLNGWKKAWTTAGYALTTAVPVVTPSDYCVYDLDYNPDVRAALSEFIVAVEDETAVPLNTLKSTAQIGGTTGIFDPSGDYVIFQGTIKGGKHVGYVSEATFATDTIGFSLFYETDAAGVQKIKSAEEIKELLTDQGIDGSKPIIAYCRAGNAASYGFMPIDAALDWDVMVYDGSWSQWGSLTNRIDVPDATYALPAELSEWATDVLTTAHTDGVTMIDPYYNVDAGKTIELPTFRILDNALTPRDSGANSIEIEDGAYAETPPAGSGAPGSTSGGSGGGC